MRERPILKRRLAYAAAATLLTLLLLEGLARVGIAVGMHLMLPPEVRRWITTHHIVFDPELGWRPAVALEGIQGSHFQSAAYERTPRRRAPGAKRGYAFGDSQTHGAGIAEHAAWPLVTESALRLGGHDIEVTNLGSSGYRSAQVLRLLELHVIPMKPDFLVVDCMMRDSVMLRASNRIAFPSLRRALFESRLYRLAWLGTAAARGHNLGANDVRIDQPEGRAESGPGNHGMIASLAAANGIPLVFVDYPYMGHPVRSLAPARDLPQGVPVARAADALNASGIPPEQLFLENNHLSVKGSEIVGREVARVLQETLGLDAVRPPG
jgi:hypothetical protein